MLDQSILRLALATVALVVRLSCLRALLHRILEDVCFYLLVSALLAPVVPYSSERQTLAFPASAEF
jgi:hypothetical protein